MATAVIVGGGVSGLAACHYLVKSAKYSKIFILEATSRVGGWAHSIHHDDGSVFELGPRSLRSTGVAGYNTLCLSEDLGLKYPDMIGVGVDAPAARNRFIYANSTLHALPTSPFKKSTLLSSRLMFPIFRELFRKTGETEDETIYNFIKRRTNQELADYVLDPVCRGIFAGNCRDLSMRSCFPDVFNAERKYGSMIKGMVSTPPVKKKRESKLAQRARAERWTIYSYKRGIQQLADSLEDSASQSKEVELLKNTPCSALEWKDGKCLVKVNGDSIVADHVFSAIYAKDLSHLLPPEHSQLSSELLKIPAVNAVVVVVELNERIDLPTPGFGHLLPSFEDGPMLGVIYDSCTFPQHDRTDKPSTRFTIMMGGAWYQELESRVPAMTEEHLGKMALEGLFKQLGIQSTASKLKVAVLKDCIPQYHIGHHKVLDNLYSYIRDHKLPLSLLGSSYKGVSVNDCINNARLDVEELTGMDLQ